MKAVQDGLAQVDLAQRDREVEVGEDHAQQEQRIRGLDQVGDLRLAGNADVGAHRRVGRVHQQATAHERRHDRDVQLVCEVRHLSFDAVATDLRVDHHHRRASGLQPGQHLVAVGVGVGGVFGVAVLAAIFVREGSYQNPQAFTDGMVRLFSEYDNKDLAYVGGTKVKYIPIGDRVEVDVGPDPDLTLVRRLKDRYIHNIKARQHKRRLDNTYVLYYDLIDYDETFVYEEEVVSGKPVVAKTEIERQFDADVYLWGSEGQPDGWGGNEPGAYVDMHDVGGRVERVDQNHVKYFLDLNPGEKRFVRYSVTYKRRKVGPELNAEKKREPV